MANHGNYLPLKLYRKLLIESYLQNTKDGEKIKDFLIKNHDPILQTQDRYIPPRTKGNILTEKYIKKMAEKPKRNPKKRIPLKNSMSSGLIVIAENKKRQGIRMHPQVRTNQDSTKSYENYKHMRTYKSKDNLKNFYLDDFNSVKENYLTRSKTNRRYLCKPKDNVIIPPEPISKEEEEKMINSFNSGFKRPKREKTHDRIFSPINKGNQLDNEEKKERKIIRNSNTYKDCLGKMFEEQGKIVRMPKVSDKPCNSNFRVLSEEAKNNASERYYFEINKNQW